MERRRSGGGITLGPRTSVWTLLQAYPGLAQALAPCGGGLERLATVEGRERWARRVTVGEVAVAADLTWRQLARRIVDEVARAGGEPPEVLGPGPVVAGDDRRLGVLRTIAAELEEGGSLLELARELQDAAGGADASEAEALERALNEADAAERAAARREMEAAAGPPADRLVLSHPEGHPLRSLRSETMQVRALSGDLRAALERLGGSPTRRRWRSARPLVARLVDRLTGVESALPAPARRLVPGPRGRSTLVGPPSCSATARTKRSSPCGDSGWRWPATTRPSWWKSAATWSTSSTISWPPDEQVLAPLAEARLSPTDWAAVRRREDAGRLGARSRPAAVAMNREPRSRAGS